jgi:magnesium dechelatase
MGQLDPSKLSVSFLTGATPRGPITPRAYTLTHSDATGNLFLTIGPEYHTGQISGWYTRLMRDEVLARWQKEKGYSLHVHCHVSGGLVFGTSRWRAAIFRRHLPMVIEAFRYGDRDLVEEFPQLGLAQILVYFHARERKLNLTEGLGVFNDYQ